MYKKATHLGLFLGVFMGVLVIGTSLASAEANGKISEDDTTTTAQTEPAPAGQSATSNDGYQFTARPGDSLSLITRRAIQVYAKAQKVELSPAQAIFCETRLTQQLGNREIEIGEQINVPFKDLEACVAASRELTDAQREAWNTYAGQVDFAVTGPDPANADADPSDTKEEEKKEGEEQAQDEKKDENKSDNNNAVSWYWWALGLAVLGVLYYLFGDRFKSEK